MGRPVTFGMVGGAWRAEFFFRIAQALPDRFRVAGCVARTQATRSRIESVWGIETFGAIDELVKLKPDFVVTSVPRMASAAMILELASQDIAVLAETPPAHDVDALVHLWKGLPRNSRIQVAEQYQFQPLHAARIALTRSGLLGEIHEAQISVAHGYHGLSLLRKFLNLGFENATIRALGFKSPVIAGPNRAGPPAEERKIVTTQIIASLEFQGKMAVFDFVEDQYFSWIRSQRVLVRGDRGEINNLDVRYLIHFGTPMEILLSRLDAGQTGNLEGYHHKGYVGGGVWWYRNPFAPARLSDDEIAIATCLESMARYLKTGEAFYGLAEASQDHYLGILIDKAVETGNLVESSTQIWGNATDHTDGAG
jgi:GFO/IDH/MocA oxidoreductase family protein